jgi:deoxyadenosine/deoxycytidine kinase
MAFRRFVLAPAAEVAADMRHPMIGRTIAEMLAHLDVRPNYVALAGPIGAGKSHLAASLARSDDWRLVGEPILDDRLAAYYDNPRREAWATEHEILRRRTALLRRQQWTVRDDWQVSDFWFDQSLTFARRWMDDGQFAEFSAEWNAAAAEVVPPKFVVWLDASTDVLLARIRRRGRSYEQNLGAATIDQLRAAVAKRLADTYRGPVLRLDAADDSQLVHEVRAAAAAMA